MKKIFLQLGAVFFSFLVIVSFAQVTFATPNDLGYVPLAPLPGIGNGQGGVSATGVNLGAYLGTMFKFGVGLCALLAVLMIVIGGFEYVMTENIASKEDAKSRITNALVGLLIALVSVTLLYTINPALVGLKDPNIVAAPATP